MTCPAARICPNCQSRLSRLTILRAGFGYRHPSSCTRCPSCGEALGWAPSPVGRFVLIGATLVFVLLLAFISIPRSVMGGELSVLLIVCFCMVLVFVRWGVSKVPLRIVRPGEEHSA